MSTNQSDSVYNTNINAPGDSDQVNEQNLRSILGEFNVTVKKDDDKEDKGVMMCYSIVPKKDTSGSSEELEPDQDTMNLRWNYGGKGKTHVSWVIRDNAGQFPTGSIPIPEQAHSTGPTHYYFRSGPTNDCVTLRVDFPFTNYPDLFPVPPPVPQQYQSHSSSNQP